MAVKTQVTSDYLERRAAMKIVLVRAPSFLSPILRRILGMTKEKK